MKVQLIRRRRPDTKHGSSEAIFSKDLKCRYVLKRIWDPSLPAVLWCMLNPSTADEQELDPTLTRCFGFSQKWGAGAMTIVNIIPYRATKPIDLWELSPEDLARWQKTNQRAIAEACKDKTHKIRVAGWGCHPISKRQDLTSLLPVGVSWECLGTTADGSPRHPLYLTTGSVREPFDHTKITRRKRPCE